MAFWHPGPIYAVRGHVEQYSSLIKHRPSFYLCSVSQHKVQCRCPLVLLRVNVPENQNREKNMLHLRQYGIVSQIGFTQGQM